MIIYFDSYSICNSKDYVLEQIINWLIQKRLFIVLFY